MTHTQYRKRIDVEKRVREALKACVATGDKPTFYTIAQRAGVARSTIYRRDDLRNLVEAGRNAWIAQNQWQEEAQVGARRKTPMKTPGEAWGNTGADAPIATRCTCASCVHVHELQARVDFLEHQLEQAQIQIAGLASLIERLDQPDHRVHTGPRAIRSFIATLSIVGSGADATVRLESCIAA